MKKGVGVLPYSSQYCQHWSTKVWFLNIAKRWKGLSGVGCITNIKGGKTRA